MRARTATSLIVILAASSVASVAHADDGKAANQQLVSDDDDVSFQMRSGQAIVITRVGATTSVRSGELYDEICRAPCGGHLSSGYYKLSLAQGDGNAARGEEVYIPPGESTVKGAYVSHASSRWLAYGIGGGGLVLGAGLALHGILGHQGTDCSYGLCNTVMQPDGVEIAIGSALALGGAIAAWVIWRPDEAHFEVTGSRLRLSPTAWLVPSREGHGSRTAPGLTLSTSW